ncbi:MAG: hypothetical protein WA112_04900 [Rugosibacter sp.]
MTGVAKHNETGGLLQFGTLSNKRLLPAMRANRPPQSGLRANNNNAAFIKLRERIAHRATGR